MIVFDTRIFRLKVLKYELAYFNTYRIVEQRSAHMRNIKQHLLCVNTTYK